MPTGSGVGFVNPALIDIDRIEVLRGPQGTLYTAQVPWVGTIRLIPHAPDLSRFEGSVKGEVLVTQGGGRSLPGGQTELVLNVPIVEGQAAVRGAFWGVNEGGFINRTWTNAGENGIATGPVVGKVGNLPDEHTWGLRTTALFQPTEHFSLSAIDLPAAHQHFDGLYGHHRRGGQPQRSAGAEFPRGRTRNPGYTSFELYNLTAKYDFGRFNLVSSTSYSDSVRESNRRSHVGPPDNPPFFGLPALPRLSGSPDITQHKL